MSMWRICPDSPHTDNRVILFQINTVEHEKIVTRKCHEFGP